MESGKRVIQRRGHAHALVWKWTGESRSAKVGARLAMENLPQTPPPLPKPARFGDTAVERMLLPVGRSGWAIAAGYLGLFSLIVLPAPIALIVSIIAISDIRKSRAAVHPKHGMGRAIFGLVMGILGTGALVMIFPHFMRGFR
jgi:hypothetical protein